MSFTAETPAKINLLLRVVDRRDDGFHELQTVFQTIDLRDTLEVTAHDELLFEADVEGWSGDRENLVWRAADALRRRLGESRGARLRLHKRIPVQGGLGGGSSDAAAAMLLCCRLWDAAPERALLEEIGRGLGADVPFFLHGGTARGDGRGDRITALRPFGTRPLLLGIPAFGVPTAEVFGRVAAWLTLPSNSVRFPALFGHKWKWPNDLDRLSNDLEKVVFDGWPSLRRFRDALLEVGAARAMLSGSGSTVFGIFEDEPRRDAAAAELEAGFEDWTLLSSSTVASGVRIRPGGAS